MLKTLLGNLKRLTWQVHSDKPNYKVFSPKEAPDTSYVLQQFKDKTKKLTIGADTEGATISIDNNTAEEVKPLYREVFDFFENLGTELINKGLKK